MSRPETLHEWVAHGWHVAVIKHRTRPETRVYHVRVCRTDLPGKGHWPTWGMSSSWWCLREEKIAEIKSTVEKAITIADTLEELLT